MRSLSIIIDIPLSNEYNTINLNKKFRIHIAVVNIFTTLTQIKSFYMLYDMLLIALNILGYIVFPVI